MRKALHRVGKKLQNQELHAGHIGLLLAACNTIVILGFILMVAISSSFMPAWLYLLIAQPILLTIFWLWFTQELHTLYDRFTIHDSLLIAKIGSLPFLLLLVVSAILFSATAIDGSNATWGLLAYFGLLMGTSSVILSLLVVFVGLQHKLQDMFKRWS